MKQSLLSGNQSCTAQITLNKNRVKVYPNNKVYLSDKQSFEIELFNPTQKRKLVKIYINDLLISSSGLVINPGQRVYLERYIDTNNRFVFETYQVEGGNSQVEKAIAKNGLIRVDFFDEQEKFNNLFNGWSQSTITYTPPYSGTSTYNPTFTTTVNGIGTTLTSGTVSNCFLSNSSLSNTSNVTMDGFSYKAKSFVPQKEVKKPWSKETGLVGKGEATNQSFGSTTGDFNSYTCASVTYQILPQSERPLEVKDLVQYCGMCSQKRKQKHLFCPKCGHKYDN